MSTINSERNKVRGVHLPNFKTYYAVTVTALCGSCGGTGKRISGPQRRAQLQAHKQPSRSWTKV